MDVKKEIDSGTFDPNAANKVWWSYYDSIIMAAATLLHRFFTIPVGQAGKGYNRTNWPLAGVMPSNEKFKVHAIEFFYYVDAAKTQATKQNWIDTMMQSFFEIVINSKTSQLLIPMIQAMGSPVDMVVGGAAAGDANTGMSMYKGCFELPIQIVLAANTPVFAQLSLTVAGNASLDGDMLYCCMVGERLYN